MKYRIKKGIKNIPFIILLLLLAGYFLFPTVFMIVSSLKQNSMQLISDMSSIKGFIPYGEIGLRNYTDMFTQIHFVKFFFNSLWILTWTISAGLLVNSMIAFSLARLNYPGRKFLLSLIIAMMIIPKLKFLLKKMNSKKMASKSKSEYFSIIQLLRFL